MDRQIHAENFKKIRQELGLTQQAFADSIEEKQTKIKDIETGKQKISVELALKVENIHHINFKWLLTGTGTMFQKTNTLFKKENSRIVDNINTCGLRIREIEEINNISGIVMSKIMDISFEDYNKIYSGEILPSISVINNIKKHFDINIDWLLYGDEKIYKREELITPRLTPEQYNNLIKLVSGEFSKQISRPPVI